MKTRPFYKNPTLFSIIILFFIFLMSTSHSRAEEDLNPSLQSSGNQGIYISDAQLIYEDSELPFSMDASFATLKRSSTEQYFWHTFGDVNYKYHGPLYDPLQNKDWVKSAAELFDYNGKGDPLTDRIFINNVYKRDNGDLLGFSHLEKFDFTIPGYVEFAIGLIYSTDNGDNWTYCGEIIRPQEDTSNIGGVPYLTIGDYFYVYFNEKPINSERIISVARAKINDVLNAAAGGDVVAWQKYKNGAWSEDGLTGAGSNIIPDALDWHHDVHSDAAYNRALGKYMLTVQTHNYGQLLLYTSVDGINWADKIVVDETAANNYIQAYSFFVGLVDATDDSREVGSEFYIFYPRKDWPDNYGYDEFYRRLVTIGFAKDPPPLPVVYTYKFSNGFSSTQGENFWYYRFRSGDAYTNMSWDGSNYQWQGNETYLLIGYGWFHPGNNGEAALQWLAPQRGRLKINGTAVHTQTGCADADGVETKILHRNKEIWSATLGFQGSADHNLSLDVVSGDALSFIVNKQGNNNCDTVNWDPTISLMVIQPGDINADSDITLADAILSLRAFCGEDISGESITVNADVNSDNLIGLAEAIFVIQTVARLR